MSKINSSPLVNESLAEIEADLARSQLDAPGLYLLGVVQKDRNKATEARTSLLQALQLCPLLWSAWLEVSKLGVTASDLPDHWVRNFMTASLALEMHNERESIELNRQLLLTFPSSVYVQN